MFILTNMYVKKSPLILLKKYKKNTKNCEFLISLMDKVPLVLLMVHKRQENYLSMDNKYQG